MKGNATVDKIPGSGVNGDISTNPNQEPDQSLNSSGSREDSAASKTSSPSSSSTVCNSSCSNLGKHTKSKNCSENTKKHVTGNHNINQQAPVVVDEFDEEDVARYESHKTEEDIAKCRRTQEKIRALREKQVELKRELEAAKGRLMIDKSRWSLECKIFKFSDRFLSLIFIQLNFEFINLKIPKLTFTLR